jgi:hypothetical protein
MSFLRQRFPHENSSVTSVKSSRMRSMMSSPTARCSRPRTTPERLNGNGADTTTVKASIKGKHKVYAANRHCSHLREISSCVESAS